MTPRQLCLGPLLSLSLSIAFAQSVPPAAAWASLAGLWIFYLLDLSSGLNSDLSKE